MATTEELKNGGSTSYPFSIEYIKAEDIKVEIDGTALTYTTNASPASGEYKVVATTVTLGATAAAGSGNVHIYRHTDLDTAAAVFAAGSSIRAADLNACHDLVRLASQEQHQLIRTPDLKNDSVTTSKIKDGTIVNADINASADIANTKIADGLLKSGITVNSANIVDGSIVDADVSNSANIQGSKLANDSVTLDKLGGGTLPSDIVVTRTNIEDGTIQDADIETGTLDNRYYTETELNNGQLNNLYYTETELDNGQLDNRYFTESELTGGSLDGRYYTETELLNGGAIDGRYYTEAELNGGQLNNLYFTESEITGGAADGRYYTETELDAGQLDNRYFTETELTGGALDGRYYTETEAEAKFLRQDSSETIASGVTWSNSDAHVATTAAINARIIDLVDEVGGFTVIATELVFPNTNPQGATGQSAILSIGALTQGYTRTGTTVTIANGTVGNSTVTITGVPLDLPSGFGLLVESTSTLNEYTFHRLVPKATEVTTVATNITNIVAAGANVADINNFADLYQISNSAPTQRVDGASLQDGDLWFDNSNGNLRVWDGSNWAIITPNQSVLNDIAIVSGAITYAEDLGLISDAVTVGSSNGSLDIVADILEDEATFTVTASGGAYFIDGVSKPALTLYKGWTYTFDLSSNTLGSHPLRFSSGGSAYSTNVTVTGTQGTSGAKVSIKIPETQPTSFAYYCTAHSGMGNTITVKDDPIKTIADNISQIQTVASDLTEGTSEIDTVATNIANVNAVGTNIANVNAVNSNATNINSVQSNASNINAVSGSITNVNSVASNMANVNNFTEKYQIASSDPSTDGGGNALAEGDLYFNTTADELKVYNGSAWQGGVTATGNFATKTGNTFTGSNVFQANNRYNDNVKAKFGTSSDLEIYHQSSNGNSIIKESGGGILSLQTNGSQLSFYDIANNVLMAEFNTGGSCLFRHAGTTRLATTSTGATITGLMTATTIDGAAGDNLQLDFGTL